METIAIALMFVLPLLFLALICAAGPVLDRLTDRRLARRPEAGRATAPPRPQATAWLRQPGLGIEQWTPAGWALVPRMGA